MAVSDPIKLRPLDDSPQVTLGYIEAALGMFLASTLANELDEGQQTMIEQARIRVEQVTDELGSA